MDIHDDNLNELLDELEIQATQRIYRGPEASFWSCQRRHPRSPFRATCTVYFFPQASATVSSLPGRTRNLSRSGVGLLVRRVFRTGEPIEIEVSVLDRPSMFMAGVVTFCRYAGRGYHEIGVCLRVAGAKPVFSQDPVRAIETTDWIRPPAVAV